MFDSNAILLYLAEKTGKFCRPPATDRGQMLSWLMFVASGVGPYSGQAVHFRNFAPEKKEYAVNRYAFEAQRHFGSSTRGWASRYMLGDTYTIVDMAVWGWSRLMPFVSAKPRGQDPQPEAPGRGDQRAAGGAARAGAQGQAHVQGRDGRRGPQGHVPASEQKVA